MSEASKSKHDEAIRNWRRRNPEKVKEYRKKWAENNREKQTAAEKSWKKAHPESKKRYSQTEFLYRLKNRYGLRFDDYTEILERQLGRCAICGAEKPGGKGKRMSVDHCHRTGKVRGLLCSRCNLMLGIINEDVSILRAAIEYLKKHL